LLLVSQLILSKDLHSLKSLHFCAAINVFFYSAAQRFIQYQSAGCDTFHGFDHFDRFDGASSLQQPTRQRRQSGGGNSTPAFDAFPSGLSLLVHASDKS
jgi:hypothetical protein